MRTTRWASQPSREDVTGSPYHLTPVRSRFDDPEREHRLYLQQLPLQRRATQAATVVVTLLTLGQFPLSRVVDGGPIIGGDAWALVIAAGTGVALAIALSLDRSPRWTLGAITAAAFVIPGMCGAIIAAGADLGAQAILLVAGGVVVAYFSSRLDLIGTVLTALTYSAITVSAWLLLGPPVRLAGVVYTLGAAVLAHVTGIAEARRQHRELRSSFAQREDLRQLSVIDVLTGLANRRAFDERMDAIWRSWVSTGRMPTILMLDIDHFKMLNDTLGHQAGDVALRMVADAIRGCLRKGSDHHVARYGGEEFVVLLPSEEHHVAHAIAERLAAAVRSAGIERAVAERTSAPYERSVTVSVGIASARATMARAQDLVDAADRQLYRAKDEGRDCVRCGDDDGLTPRVAASPLRR